MGQNECFRCMRSLDENDHLRFLTRTCEPCFNILVSSRDEALSAYLESLELPAALLAQDRTVLFANRCFQEMKIGQDVLGLRVGQVLGCMYSPLLGRCGETVTCILCSLRRSIEETQLTGQGLRGVPIAYPHKEDVRRAFNITTEKAGDAVLLMLERSAPVIT
jgi:hypothetical protein